MSDQEKFCENLVRALREGPDEAVWAVTDKCSDYNIVLDEVRLKTQAAISNSAGKVVWRRPDIFFNKLKEDSHGQEITS
jgi:hypothetical protein